MGKEPCSNCGQTSCNGVNCYYGDDSIADMVQVRREDLEKAIDLFGQIHNEWLQRLRKAVLRGSDG